MSKKQILSLEDLGGAMSSFPLAGDEKNGDDKEVAISQQVPEIPAPPELPEISAGPVDFETQGAKMREGRIAIGVWVGKCLSELDKLARLPSEEARYLARAKVSELTAALERSLADGFAPYRRAAWVALLRHEFSRNFSTKEEVERLLGKLVSEGRLVSCTDGKLAVYGKTYSVHPDALVEDPDVSEIKKDLDSLLSRVYQEVGKARQAKAQDLASQATISSLADFLAGKPGTIYVVVPPAEEVSRNGQKFWRAGGGLLLESNGQDVAPLGASGGIELAMAEAMELGVFLKLYTLKWNQPPVVKGLDPERGRKVQLIWYLLDRVVKAARGAEQVQANRQQLLGRATCTAEEWFMRCASGICALHFPTWEIKTPTSVGQLIRDLLVLFERRDDGTIAIVEVQAADPLGDFFTSCEGAYEVTGEKFEGVPYPLGMILRAGYGLALRAWQDAQKAEEITVVHDA